MSETHLLSLPRELRDLVYSYILPDRIQLVQAGCENGINFHNTNGILLVNHQLRHEALDAFYRQLPATTILAPRDARIPFLRFPRNAHLRQKTQNLVIHTSCFIRNLNHFTLLPMSNQHTNFHLLHIVQSMPALRKVTCEIRWEPNQAPAVLLPYMKESMLVELRRVAIGYDTLKGWDVDCQVRDPTRWKNQWSGVVVLRKI